MTKKQKKVERKLLNAVMTQTNVEHVSIAVKSYFTFISACGNAEERKRRALR